VATTSPPPSVSGFDALVVFLLVDDLERSHRFYAGDLELPLVLDQGSCRIYRIAGSGYLGICERTGAGRREGVIVTLVTDDVDGWHRRLEACGVAVEQGPRSNREYRVYHAFFRDPDGYLVEIQRFEDPRWPRA
jgi:catechol 2,3-dioxygenase-like lactoylglutathione lyase family enzyme